MSSPTGMRPAEAGLVDEGRYGERRRRRERGQTSGLLGGNEGGGESRDQWSGSTAGVGVAGIGTRGSVLPARPGERDVQGIHPGLRTWNAGIANQDPVIIAFGPSQRGNSYARQQNANGWVVDAARARVDAHALQAGIHPNGGAAGCASDRRNRARRLLRGGDAPAAPPTSERIASGNCEEQGKRDGSCPVQRRAACISAPGGERNGQYQATQKRHCKDGSARWQAGTRVPTCR